VLSGVGNHKAITKKVFDKDQVPEPKEKKDGDGGK